MPGNECLWRIESALASSVGSRVCFLGSQPLPMAKSMRPNEVSKTAGDCHPHSKLLSPARNADFGTRVR